MDQYQEADDAKLILEEIEQIAENESLPIVGPEKGAILAMEIRKAKPKNVLEVGTLIGYSAILIGRELRADARFVSIEKHLDEVELARRYISRANIQPQIEVIVGDALEVIPSFSCCFDFVFIDAEKSEYYQYLKLAEDILTKNAVIVADNAGIFAEEMKNYLNYVRCSGNYNSKFVKVGNDALEISVKL